MAGNAGRVWLAAASTSLALVCCGQESNREAAGGTPTAAPPAAPVEAADIYVWDPAKGAAPDLAADSAECQSQITMQGLSAVAQHIHCMKRKGWKARPPGS